MPKHKHEPKHIFQSIPIEMVHSILSYLSLNDLVCLAQINRWMYGVISPLRLDYHVLSIGKAIGPTLQHRSREKVIIWTEERSTYTQLRKKLTSQLSYKKEWLKTLARVEYENANLSDPMQVTMQAMSAIGVTLFTTAVPVMGGCLIDAIGVDISAYLFGYTSSQVGYALSLSMLTGFVGWILKVTYDNKDEPDYSSVQLIEENTVSVGNIQALRY